MMTGFSMNARVYVEVVVPVGNTGSELSCVALTHEEIPASEYRNEEEIAKALRRLADKLEFGTTFRQYVREERTL
jgi:hypothetical protein